MTAPLVRLDGNRHRALTADEAHLLAVVAAFGPTGGVIDLDTIAAALDAHPDGSAKSYFDVGCALGELWHGGLVRLTAHEFTRRPHVVISHPLGGDAETHGAT